GWSIVHWRCGHARAGRLAGEQRDLSPLVRIEAREQRFERVLGAELAGQHRTGGVLVGLSSDDRLAILGLGAGLIEFVRPQRTRLLLGGEAPLQPGLLRGRLLLATL